MKKNKALGGHFDFKHLLEPNSLIYGFIFGFLEIVGFFVFFQAKHSVHVLRFLTYVISLEE